MFAPVYICLFLAQSAYQEGVALFEKGQYAAAIPHLVRASHESPRDAQVWKALGVAYAAQNLYPEAEPPLHRACEIDPKLPDACYFYARTLYALDRFEAALRLLEGIAPKSWKVRLAAAQALEALGRAADAEREFRGAVTDAADASPQPGTAFGLFLLRQGRFADAAAPLDRVVSRFPAAAEARLHFGRVLLEQDKITSAIVQLERAVAADGSSVQAHLLLAKAYVRAGRDADAQPHFEAAAAGVRE